MYDSDVAIRRQTITGLILRKIGEAGVLTFDVFFPPQYSYAQVSRLLFGVDGSLRANPQTVSSLLSRLRRQGLVARNGSRGAYSWRLTKRGRERTATYAFSEVPAPDGISRLVIFDIPERERKKRDVVRAELIACNFRRLQKSVWIGENPLPEDFLTLVDDLRLKQKLHIFSIREHGTIKES